MYLMNKKKIKSRERAKVENILEIPKADRPNWSVRRYKS